MVATTEKYDLPLPLPFNAEREDILLPRLRRNLVEFAENELTLTNEKGKDLGPFSWDLTPFWIEVAFCLSDVDIDQVTTSKCTQSGGTTLANAFTAWIVCESPDALLTVLPTEAALGRRVKRLKGMFAANPILMQHLGHLRNLTENGADLDNMNMYTGFAGSAITLSDVPLPYVIMDETGKYPAGSGKEGNPVGQGRARQRWFYYRMLFVNSSPVQEEDVLDNELNAGDMCEDYVPCPHCNYRQILTWDQYLLDKGEDGHLLDHEEYTKGDHARYVCAKCACEWTEQERWQAVTRGVWIPAGMPEDKMAERFAIWEEFWRNPNSQPDSPKRPQALISLYKKLKKNHTSKHRSFHLPAFYLPPNTTDAGTLAKEYAFAIERKKAAQIKYLQNFINLQCAEPWKETEKSFSEASLRDHRVDMAVDLVPKRAQLLTCGIDVQKHGFYVVICAWGYMWECWPIFAEWIDAGCTVSGQFQRGETDQPYNYQPIVQGLLPRAWEHEGHTDRIGLTSTGIDSGDGNVTHIVYSVCDNLANPDFFFPAKGVDNQEQPIMVKFLNEDEGRHGRKRVYRPNAIRVNVSTLTWKNRLYQMMSNPYPGPGYIHMPDYLSDEFWDQITSEELKTTYKNGQKKLVWKLKKRRMANHYLDAFVLAAVAAHRAGVNRLVDIANVPDMAEPIRRGSRRKKRSSAAMGRF